MDAQKINSLREKAKAAGISDSTVEEFIATLKAQEPKPSKLESALRGAAQGLSLGFEDEARAAIMAPFSDKDYSQVRDEIRAKNVAAQEENPITYSGSELGGGVVGSFIPGLNLGKAATLGGAALRGAGYGAAASLGRAQGTPEQQALQTAIGTAVGGGTGLLGEGLARGMKKLAPQLAKMATGATGKEAEKFKKEAGESLLDMGIVGFGDSPKSIAKKADKALKVSGKGIENSLKMLDDEGARVSKDQLMAGLLSERTLLAADETQGGVVKKLDSIILDLSKTPASRTLEEVEKAGRGWQNKVNYDLLKTKPNTANAYATAARVYKNAVLDTAEAVNPNVAKKLADDRALYGLLKPIKMASEKRASTLNQQQIGGLLDLTAAGAGGILGYGSSQDREGSIGGALAGIAARRFGAPRAASSLATTLNKELLQEATRRLPLVTSEQILPLIDLTGTK